MIDFGRETDGNNEICLSVRFALCIIEAVLMKTVNDFAFDYKQCLRLVSTEGAWLGDLSPPKQSTPIAIDRRQISFFNVHILNVPCHIEAQFGAWP